MNKAAYARIWFGIIALSVAIVIPTQAVLSAHNTDGEFQTAGERVVNMFCFFTIQSNIIVGLICLFLIIKPKINAAFFNTFLLDALVCITVTGIIYHLLLAGQSTLTGLAVVTDLFLHTFVPLAFVIGWLVFGPRSHTSWRIVKLSLIFPIGWAVFAMIRGAIIHYYPYPFMDVNDLGYAHALIDMAFVTVFFIALFIGAYFLDQKLSPHTT